MKPKMKRTLLPLLTALLLVSCPNPSPNCGFDPCRIALDLSNQDIALEQGASVPLSITPTSNNGYAGSIELSVADMPSGVTPKLEPKTVQVGGTPTKSVLTLTADATAVVGVTAEVTITAVGQTVGAQRKFKLTIKAKPVTPPGPTPPTTPPSPPATPPAPPPVTPPPPITSMSPTSASVKAGGGPQTFTATAPNNAGVFYWSLNPNIGTLSSDTGASVSYTPPATITQSTSVTLTAAPVGTGVSGSATITIAPVPSPSAPGSFTASAASSSAINLSWTAPMGVTAYILERNSGSGYVLTTPPSASATTYTDSGLAAGTSYTYRLTATNSGGASPSVEASSSTVKPPITATSVNVSPKTVQVCDSSIPIQFTATLAPNGSMGTLEWSTNPNVGSFSNTTGLSVMYTPPPGQFRVDQTVALTVKIKESGAVASSTITVLEVPSPLCVTPPPVVLPPI